MIQSVFRAEGLPLDLAYVPLIESAFKTNALSRASAKGVWQFMRPTAIENGLKHDWYVDERSDPQKATLAAAKYLKTLSRMFDGDWHLALASYNGGPGRVQRAMKRYGRDDFWSLSSNPRWLPRETREYVPMILAAVIIARNPDPVRLHRPGARNVRGGREGHRGRTDRLAPGGRVDLDAGGCHPADESGTASMDNAGARPGLRAESAARKRRGAAARLAEADAAERGALNWHTVRPGESIATIARKLRVNRADLAEANYMSVRSRVRAGQKLIIPRAPAVLMAAQPDRPTPEAEARPEVERASIVTESTRAESSSRSRQVYRVKRGDTLSSIARLFETSVSAIKQWNRLRSNRINPGQRLTVYTAADR